MVNLSGKKGLILGIANKDSLAWGIAEKAVQAGAELIVTYQNDVLKKRVLPLASSIGVENIFPCDVSEEGSISTLFEQVGKVWSEIDFVLHGVAFSDKSELKGLYINTSRNNFLNTLLISCYSFTELAFHAQNFMKDKGGSLLTLSYYGAEKVIPHYNVMGVAKAALESSVRYLASDLGPVGIRVNALSCGPVRTLAAAGGIDGFNYILKWIQDNAPLRRGITQEDAANSALYYFSDLSCAVTGSIHPVDSGYHVVGMKAVDAPDLERVVV